MAATTSTELPARIIGVFRDTGDTVPPVAKLTVVWEAAAGADTLIFDGDSSLLPLGSRRQNPNFPAVGCGFTGTKSDWRCSCAITRSRICTTSIFGLRSTFGNTDPSRPRRLSRRP